MKIRKERVYLIIGKEAGSCRQTARCTQMSGIGIPHVVQGRVRKCRGQAIGYKAHHQFVLAHSLSDPFVHRFTLKKQTVVILQDAPRNWCHFVRKTKPYL